MVWPFSRKNKLTDEERLRVARRCALGVATLRNCRAANPDKPGVCDALETQVVSCHAEVVCPDAAVAYRRCFMKVVNSKGEFPYSTCDTAAAAMKKCLKKKGLYPFEGASSR